MDTEVRFSWHHHLIDSPLLRHASTRRLHSTNRCCQLALCKLSTFSISPPQVPQSRGYYPELLCIISYFYCLAEPFYPNKPPSVFTLTNKLFQSYLFFNLSRCQLISVLGAMPLLIFYVFRIILPCIDTFILMEITYFFQYNRGLVGHTFAL